MSYPYGPDPHRADGGQQPAGSEYGYTGESYPDLSYSAQPYPEQPYVGAQPHDYGQPYVGGQPYAYGHPYLGEQQPYSAQPYGGYPYGQPYPGAQRRTNGMAIGALVAAVCGIVTCGISSLVGAILGHVALGQIRRSGEDGHGLALAGVIVGWIVTALFLAYWIVVAVVAATGN